MNTKWKGGGAGGNPPAQSHQAPRRAIYSWWDSPKGSHQHQGSPDIKGDNDDDERSLTSRTTPDGRTVQNGSALHDAGMANMSIAVEATTRGLMLRMMGGYDRDAARVLVAGAHAGIEPVTMMAVGYAGAGESLPEDVRSRDAAPRSRLPIDELLIAKID